ncbi:MAG: alpha/beta fold hydrolase [Gammaproteobacteria bacterium]|nr:alpha/beta fold hydrolase [Gammaproteobacteria bacterium]
MSGHRKNDSAYAGHWTDWSVSVLNGVLGDYLCERDNGLAIEQMFYHRNRPLATTTESLRAAYPHPTAKLCILLHGLACNEGVWVFRRTQDEPARCYGTLLQQELGYTPFFLRYNTGLPIAVNGRRFAGLLEEMLACYPVAVEEIVLLGHSMGGLVVRSACHYGTRMKHGWVNKVRHAFYLGTPHDGADLEVLGALATSLLQTVPHPLTRVIAKVLNRRSRGIKDLRRSDRLCEDAASDDGSATPWIPGAWHHLFVGTLTDDPQGVASQLFGDGLVRPPRSPARNPAAAEQAESRRVHVTVFPGVHHMGLANDPGVYEHIKLHCMTE